MESTALGLFLDEVLRELESSHRLRRRSVVKALDATHVEIAGRRYVNFASNNYLGLTHHPAVLAAAQKAMQMNGFGAGAAPLVSGYTELHQQAEQAIAAWKGAEDALLLPSGYQANHAAIGAVAAVMSASGKRVRFLLDKLVHASLIDAVRATEQPYRVFPHNGMGKLQRLLDEADADEVQVVVTESIFSMDGDAADLSSLAAMKRERPFILILDEAHASGVYGPQGSGYAAELNLRGVVDLSIMTLSKALGAVGGAVCASTRWCEAIVNFGRAYLFSTSLPPSVVAAVTTAIDVMRNEPARQVRVRLLATHVRDHLRQVGLLLPQGDSPIIPIPLVSESAALDAAMALRDAGQFVIPIRPPTVPRGTSRLRITLSSEHTDEEIAALLQALRRCCPQMNTTNGTTDQLR